MRYNEHNYGHGYNNLCSVMTMLMMLAFLIDQVQQLCCKVYQGARRKAGALYSLFEQIRVLFKFVVWDNWSKLYGTIMCPETNPPPIGILTPE